MIKIPGTKFPFWLKKKFGTEMLFQFLWFCKKKNNHVGFRKMFFLIMVYKKNSSQQSNLEPVQYKAG